MNASIKELASKGLANVPYPPEFRVAVESAISWWKEFCALPEETRVKFPYDASEGMGVGYELKKTPGTTLDLKEDFHFTRASASWLAEQALRIGTPDIIDFVQSVSDLERLMKPTVFDFAERVEAEYGLPGFADEIKANSERWFIRFLHYFGGAEAGEEIAKAHADKSGFTLHLYESDPGLQYLDKRYEWRDVLMVTGETVILPGMRGQYRSEDKIKATFHRVIATPETAQKGRYSAVAFIHPDARVPQYDKAGAGRLQEMKPGFNYEMPFVEFAKLFKK